MMDYTCEFHQRNSGLFWEQREKCLRNYGFYFLMNGTEFFDELMKKRNDELYYELQLQKNGFDYRNDELV